jgi:hypothetical protein
MSAQSHLTTEEFLEKLEQEATLQSRLQQQRLLPQQIDWLTSIIGRYPWQTILVLSGFVAFLLEVT